MSLFERILIARGLVSAEDQQEFINPDYELSKYNPFLLPDIDKAVERLVRAHSKQEHITIYGDYDIDGLTASTVLIDAFESFGFQYVDIFIPNRFVEGYGLTIDAVERIASTGATLIVTVDCGSLSEKEIVRAAELGVDVIVTDHHNVAPVQPPAVAVINPKRLLQDYPDDYEGYLLKKSSKQQGKIYPFVDLAGVGVAFKLVQALQTKLDGLGEGQEKWLLDLVALGTVCDIVSLIDENRTNVYWGLRVMSKTRRPGLKALMAVSNIEPEKVTARSLGFGLGPRMNAAGRLETAQYALDMLRATKPDLALEKAQILDDMNQSRRTEQDKIFEEAKQQAEELASNKVLVVSSKGWSHGIIGIVAAKLLEKYKKPTFVLEEVGEESKGSARSFGDFSVADAIRAADDIIIKGGGHKFAAGVTLSTNKITDFRTRVNEYYSSLQLAEQEKLLLPQADIEIGDFAGVDEQLVAHLRQLEPFGNANSEPVLKATNATVIGKRQMGTDGQHIKLTVRDTQGSTLCMLAFSAPKHFFVEVGTKVSAWFQPTLNEWNGTRSVEGRLMHLEVLPGR